MQNNRDLIGYGPNPPNAQWPNNANIAVQFVVNYEEGAERTTLNGDEHSETFLIETQSTPIIGSRDINSETQYEYGSRAGFWRIMDLLKRKNVRCTIFAVAQALEMNPLAIQRIIEDDHEIASHNYRWLDYYRMNETLEREHIQKAFQIIKNITGRAPRGWYTGRISQNSTRHMQFLRIKALHCLLCRL
jgi:peptidoglycan/xylan/chitin deacetylase (PgdA/CDA1 family)